MCRATAFVLGTLLTLAGCRPDSVSPTPAADSPEGLVLKGQAAFNQGRYAEAVERYQEALRLQPGSATAYNLLGMAYRFQYNRQPASALKDQEIAAFRQAVELDAKNVAALINLGSSLYHAGQKPEAAQTLQRALTLMPAHPEADAIRQMVAEGEAQPEGGE